MKSIVNLSAIHRSNFFFDYIHPVFAREFLFMNKYEDFANLLQLHFILTEAQWETVLNEWELKESILS